VTRKIKDLERHLRLPDYEFFDEIRLVSASRWKESEMSGDEWRTIVGIELWFKGQVMARATGRDIKTALMLTCGLIYDDLDYDKKLHLQLDQNCCDQLHCAKNAKVKLWLKKRYTPDGETIATTAGTRCYRKFCTEHAVRGHDAGWEDRDTNYDKDPGK
jgi:hypothetical protein